MTSADRYCAICAWREDCSKRFSIKTDSMGNVYCPDFTRDLSIKKREKET